MEQLAELRHLISTHCGDNFAALPGVRMVRAEGPTTPISTIAEPAFGMVAQGGKRAILGERTFDYNSGQYLVVSVDLPIISQVIHATSEEPYLAFRLNLRPAAIATLLLETALAEHVATEPAGMAVSNAPAELLDSIIRLIRLLDRPEDAAVLGPMLEREILWRLLTGEQGAMVRQIGLTDSRLSQVGRAIRFIRNHYAETLKIEDLADAARMTPSTFYRNFRAVTAMSPVQYQKQIRLLEARARLIAHDRNIAAIGFDVGYDSPSQFSREYSRMFGSPPGRDVARLRSEPLADHDVA
ncbi:MAG: AraC family transcriptional regulator [Rhizobiaceae bacterium]|nr:AraC family transcriptional regulator [Rhizobiaceae bacterium]